MAFSWPSENIHHCRPLCACRNVGDIAFRQRSRRPLERVPAGQRLRSMPVHPDTKQVTPILIVRGFSGVRAIHQAAVIRGQHHVLDHEVTRRQKPRVAAGRVYCI